eukprot:TCONS_00031585-protein
MAQSKKKKLSCFVGERLNEECGLTWFGSNDSNCLPVNFGECRQDPTTHLSSLGFSDETIFHCPNTNEQWLIMHRLQFTIPDEALICPKHRLKFGLGWKPEVSCQYPSHKKSKLKAKNMRKIPISTAAQCHLLFSSAGEKTVIQVGSKWCSSCRVKCHP